jgi:hypothetical protein
MCQTLSGLYVNNSIDSVPYAHGQYVTVGRGAKEEGGQDYSHASATAQVVIAIVRS